MIGFIHMGSEPVNTDYWRFGGSARLGGWRSSQRNEALSKEKAYGAAGEKIRASLPRLLRSFEAILESAVGESGRVWNRPSC